MLGYLKNSDFLLLQEKGRDEALILRLFHLAGALATKLNVVVILSFLLSFRSFIIRFWATRAYQNAAR